MLNIYHGRVLSLLILSAFVHAQNADIPRWGQAVALVGSTLFVQGGRTDPYSSFSYTMAPVNNDLFSLSLSNSFSLSTPPWQYLSGCSNCSTSQGPAVAWHTITPFNTTNLLLFGGDAGPNSPIAVPVAPDSAVLLNLGNGSAPIWNFETQSWANEPVRRIYHTASSSGGKVFIVGGQKDDDSGTAFSDNYVFDPSGPSFTSISSTNAPPDVTGHQAVVTNDGRLLIFGGYSPSQKSLIPMTTIWSLDTSNPTAAWTTLSVSTSNVPSPRRGFAAAMVDGGKVVIQGGADAVLQNSFEDGWMLDTSQNPAVWTSVSALSQLGPRRDHFALGVGSLVFLGFGFAQNGGAPAPLELFDTSSGTFLTSYTPPSAITTPTIATLPMPSQTNTGSNPQGSGTGTGTPVYGSAEIPYPTGSPGTGHGGGSGNSPSGSGGSGNGNGNNGTVPSAAAEKHSTIVIALSTTFGVLALLVASVAATWYIRRRRSREDFQHLLNESSDDGGEDHAIPVASMREKNQTLPPALRNVKDRLSGFIPGRSPAQQYSQRIDMLADEDTREYDDWYHVRRDPSSGHSSWASRRSWRRPTLDIVYDSLRSAGDAVLGIAGAAAAGARSLKSREGSTGSKSTTTWRREKSTGPFDPYGDNVGLVSYGPPPMNASRPRGGRQASSYSYKDPFEDYEVESLNYDPEVLYHDEPETHGWMPSLSDPPPRPNLQIHTFAPRATTDLTRLTPVSEKTSVPTFSDPASSSDLSLHPEMGSSPFLASNASSSQTSHDPPQSPRRPSSIIDTNPSSNQLMRRSDSWWSRFAKTPLLDRRYSTRSSEHRPLEFKDPNPPPRLMPIEESTYSNSPESPESKHRAGSSGHNRIYSSTAHGRSASSLQTARTANSETLERMGQTMQVIQKGSTMSSHSSGPSVDTRDESPERARPSSEPALSVIMSSHSQSEGASAEALVQSPMEMTEDETSHNLASIAAEFASSKQPSPPSTPESKSGSVAARIQAYERRMSQMEDTPIKSPPPIPNRSRRIAPAYGLAPKSPLFVANPDHKRSSGSS